MSGIDSISIQPCKLENLKDVIGESEFGRFVTIRFKVRKMLQNCPKDEFRILPLKNGLWGDKKERNAIRSGIQSMLNKKMRDWTTRVSNLRKAIVIIRKKDLKTLMPGAR